MLFKGGLRNSFESSKKVDKLVCFYFGLYQLKVVSATFLLACFVYLKESTGVITV